MEREREREAVFFLSPLRTRGRNITWLGQEEVCLLSAHGHVIPAYASTEQTISNMKGEPALLLLSFAYESQNQSVVGDSKTLLTSTLKLHRKKCKRCTKPAKDLHGGLWWMALWRCEVEDQTPFKPQRHVSTDWDTEAIKATCWILI